MLLTFFKSGTMWMGVVFCMKKKDFKSTSYYVPIYVHTNGGFLGWQLYMFCHTRYTGRSRRVTWIYFPYYFVVLSLFNWPCTVRKNSRGYGPGLRLASAMISNKQQHSYRNFIFMINRDFYPLRFYRRLIAELLFGSLKYFKVLRANTFPLSYTLNHKIRQSRGIDKWVAANKLTAWDNCHCHQTSMFLS